MHIKGPNGGFLPITPRLGYPPMQTSDQAPDTGYQPELVIDRDRLKTMRHAAQYDIIEAYNYFYFRVGGFYGKGSICWARTHGKGDKEICPVDFSFDVWTQHQQRHDRNLTFRGRSIP